VVEESGGGRSRERGRERREEHGRGDKYPVWCLIPNRTNECKISHSSRSFSHSRSVTAELGFALPMSRSSSWAWGWAGLWDVWGWCSEFPVGDSTTLILDRDRTVEFCGNGPLRCCV
jgi:hypothetical protein